MVLQVVFFSNVVGGLEPMGATAVHCPLDRMVLETDAPYLATEPFEIPALAEKVAELWPGEEPQGTGRGEG
eukprot:Skav210049  [mRNA]  locus=scaffold1016:25471:26652:+ [translate_table: standard]